jgi:allantoin racemase
MSSGKERYRFLLVPAFRLPKDSPFEGQKSPDLPKEERLMNFANLRHLLEDVHWDMHEGALATYGNWTVENREEFCYSAAGRLPVVREACASGKYNAIVLLGGGEPGFFESREISRRFNVVVASCAFSQMHVASMLGNKFAVIDFSDTHNMYYHNLVVQHRFTERCASIRNIGYYHAKPQYPGEPSLGMERDKALRGEPSEAVERAVKEAVDALENDGADVITLGCSALFWVQPLLQKRLAELGWEVPVLEGYSCAIQVAKLMVDLRLNASGLAFPSDRPKKRPRKIVF